MMRNANKLCRKVTAAALEILRLGSGRLASAILRIATMQVGVIHYGLLNVPGRFYCHRQPHRVVRTTAALLLATGISMASLFVVWWTSKPFGLFTDNVFESVGLTSEYLSADEVVHNFQRWSDSGMWSSMFTATASCILAAKVLITGSFKFVLPFFASATAVFFLGVLVPPFTFLFRDGFVLEDMNSTTLDKDPSIRTTFESGIGTGFAAVAFSWYCVVSQSFGTIVGHLLRPSLVFSLLQTHRSVTNLTIATTADLHHVRHWDTSRNFHVRCAVLLRHQHRQH